MKIKTISKRLLTLLLTVLMLVSTMTIGIATPSAANVELAPTGYDLKCVFIYDNSKTKWSSVQLMIGHNTYSEGHLMNKIANTDLWYYNQSSTWGGATHIAVFNASSQWGGENNSVSHRVGYMDKNSSAKALSGNMTSGIQLLTSPSTATSSTDNFALTTSYYSSFSGLNADQTAKVQSADAGSTSYTDNTAAGSTSISTYKLSSNTASTSSSGTTSASAARTATVTMKATASNGYTFVGWYNSDGVQQTTSTTLTYTCTGSTATYIARFQKQVQNVTATFKDYDDRVIDTVVVASGTAPTPPADPTREGYTFTGWSPTVGAITANTTYTAQYTINSYNVTATASPAAGGTVTKTASTVNHGDSVTLTAEADTTNGWAFVGWEVNGEDMGISPSITISDVKSNINATAKFQQIPTFTVKGVVGLAGAGTVSPTQHEVAEGSAIILTAVPNTGYVFTGWTIVGDYTGQSGTTSSQSFSIIPLEDVTATANFRAVSANVNFAASTGGTVSNSGSNTATYPNGVISTATANTGYTFSQWEVTGGALNTDYTMTGSLTDETITIVPINDNANITVTATFTINKYTVTFVDHDGTELSTQSVEYGKGATAPAEPTRKGYTFKGWDNTFNNITADTTVTATYTANTYTVTADVLGAGGTATADKNSVTYPEIVTLTATAENDHVFNGWTIDGAYEVVEGSVSSATFVIRPVDDITATANFVKGQYLTVYSFSENGYKNLYVWEKNGTTNDVNGVWPGTPQSGTTKFNGVDWDTSNQLELTYGYSTEVGAVLSSGTSSSAKEYDSKLDAFLEKENYRIVVFTRPDGWGDPYLHHYASGGGSTTWPGDKMTWAYNNSMGQAVFYAYVPMSHNMLIFNNNGSSQLANIGPLTDADTAVAYYKDGSSNGTKTWSIDTYATKTGDILLTDYLYDGNTWKGVSEVWITEAGVVTLRRDLLDLITSVTEEYNGGTNAKDYTAESWTAFVNAYNDAYSKSGAAASTQEQIDAAEAALQEAYSKLELQAYYTVNVTQTGAAGGTVKVDSTLIDTETGSAQIAQNKEVKVTVTAPDGYYIASITGVDTEVTNQVSPVTADLTVDADKEINVTYKANPKVSVNQLNGNGTVTVNASADLPVSVTYSNKATINVAAPEGMYILSVIIGGNSYTNTDESLTNNEYTIDSVTADTTVIVTYGVRETYDIVIGAYDNTQGTLSIGGVNVPAEGDTYTYYLGESVTITATPAEGFGIEELLVDGNAVNGNSYNFNDLNDNHTVSVTWVKLKQVTVTVNGNPNAAGNVTAESGDKKAQNKGGTNTITVLQNSVIELKAEVTDPCYEFVNWTIDGAYTPADTSTRSDEVFNIIATGDIKATANFTKVNRKIYLNNAANWSQPYIYCWGGSSSFTAWPGDKMVFDSVSGYWVGYVPIDITNLQFNDGTNQKQIEFNDVSKNLYNNSTITSDTYVEKGYYLQGTWNGKNYSGYDLQKFEDNGDGTYSLTITVDSTTDGYIYVNPTNENSHFWNAETANATDNPQTLKALGAYTATPNQVKVEIDTQDFKKAYDVTFTFNPTTGTFSWSIAQNVPTISVMGTDGRGKNEADVNMISPDGRVGDTYFDTDTVNRVDHHTHYDEAQVVAGSPVTFYTLVNKNSSTDGYDYYVAGWVVNGTEFVSATNLGNGLYSGSYVFTEDSDIVPVYFHTDEWLAANNVNTVTVYAVADKNITNWDKYLAAYTWYKVGETKVYEQFGAFPGQLMIPIAGLDNVYYTIIETSTGTGTQISGVTFNNYAPGDGMDTFVTDYGNLQTYDYYEFIALLEDGKENITFVIKDTNDTYNSDKVASGTNETLSQFDFVQYTDYSGLKTDIFGNSIEDTDATLSDSNALYVIQAGDKKVYDGTLSGDWYVESYLYNATGTYLGKCYSYELHDQDAAIWNILGDYEGQRAYFCYEHVNNNRYDGEWYGDADVSVEINLSVNVALTTDGGKTYTIKATDPVNEADYGTGYINVQYQNVDVSRGTMVTVTATPKTGYKFVGWYSADKTLFTTNTTYTIMAAVGTTYTAVFEKLEKGYFYVNHYIYQGVGTAGYVPPAHGGNAVLYVGIENVSQGTKTSLLQGNSAYIEAIEGEKLVITIATDATGADKFYAWYTDAKDKFGLTTFEEVGVDSDDNLWNNNGTVVGRNDMVYFQFEYTVKDNDDFSMNLYSDLMPVSVNVTLIYQYTDRFDNIKSYYVPYTLTAEEIDGFAGNNFTKYTPAYISGDGWENAILAHAPYVEDYYKDTTWIINDAMYDTLTFLLWATQPYTMYNVTVHGNDGVPMVSEHPYNYVLRLDAAEMFGCRSGEGFWYEDINKNSVYDEGEDKIITYNAYYGYRVTADIVLGYQKIDVGELDFSVSLDAPVLGREQETDTNGKVTSDKILVDYMINIITPNFYGDEGYKNGPTYMGNKLEGNWNGAHVTIEDYETVENVTIEYGVIVEQFGGSIKIDGTNVTYDDALDEVNNNRGYGNEADEADLIAAVESKQHVNKDKMLAYQALQTENQMTNFNRVLLTISYKNTEQYRGNFYKAYGYVKVTEANGEVKYYFSASQDHNIYKIGTSDAVVNNNTTF